MGFRGGGVKLTPPPRTSWFSSTPAGIGLRVFSLSLENSSKYRIYLFCLKEKKIVKKIKPRGDTVARDGHCS